MVAKLTGTMNDTKISISGNQMFVVFKSNNETVKKGFHALIIESKYFDKKKFLEISTYYLTQSIDLYFIGDHCQYWLNKTDGTLTSPNFGVTEGGFYRKYSNNLNCIWIINADHGFYITIEIEYFDVNNNDDTNININLLLY